MVASIWLFNQAIAPDVYSRLVDKLPKKTELQLVQSAVSDETGLRLGRPYKRWLRADSTWPDLVSRRQNSYERLVQTLVDAEAHGTFRRRPEDRVRAGDLVDATIRHFLPSLDASLAVAVAEHRSEERHSELLARFDANDSFESRLDGVPPAVAKLLTADPSYHGIAERIVEAVTSGEPKDVLRGWAKNHPSWLNEAPGPVLVGLGLLAQAYDMRLEASVLFEQAGDLGYDAGVPYLRAAIEASATGDAERTNALLANARNCGTGNLVDIVEAGLSERWDSVLEVDDESALTHPLIAVSYVSALCGALKHAAAISFLYKFLDLHPEHGGLTLLLAQLLQERSVDPATTSRQNDRAEAIRLAILVRDQRRRWRGDSSEAVRVACRVALLSRDFARAIHLGSVAPEGEALAHEAADPEVQFCVGQASIASGRLATAEATAASSNAFHQALLHGDILDAQGAPQVAVDDQFGIAWTLALSEQEKVAFWLSASNAGVDPLPGADELLARSDELPAICTAALSASTGRFVDAEQILRGLRQSESASQLLVSVYMREGKIDAAIAQLRDMAQRFTNVDHAIRAVEVLVQADRLDEAAALADSTLASVQVGRPERSLLHEIGVAASATGQRWADMERRVRAWIDECKPTPRRRWALIQAQCNQADLERAWQTLQEDESCSVERATEAQLWIALNARFRPGSPTLKTALAFAERFADNGVRAAAVNAFLLRPHGSNLDASEIARFQELVRLRAEADDPDDTFQAVDVGQSETELVEAFRSLLEPQAQRVEDLLARVRRDGWPYGVLSMATGRQYTKVLVHRAAGYIPIASPDPEIVTAEVAGALAALESGNALIDLSAIAVGWYIRHRWPELLAAFDRCEVTDTSKVDASASAAGLLPRTTSTLGWDLRTGRPIIHESDEALLDRVDGQVAWMNEQISSMSVRSSESDGPGNTDPRSDPWLDALRTARDTGTALWADDVGLRQLAREEGVVTFGTPALLSALVTLGKVTVEHEVATLDTLRDEYCADLPVSERWLTETVSGGTDKHGPALFAISRPALWGDVRVGYRLWVNLLGLACSDDPSAAPSWVYAATSAVCARFPESLALSLAAGVLAQASQHVYEDPQIFASCAQAAAAAAAAAGFDDPTEGALRVLLELGSQGNPPDQVAAAIGRIGAALVDDQRRALQRVLFNLT